MKSKMIKIYNGLVKLFTKNKAFQLILILMILVFCFALYTFTIKSNIGENQFYRIEKGASISSVALDMKSKGLIGSEWEFKIAARLNGNKVQAGEYELKKRRGTWKIVRAFSKGKIASMSVLIPEGTTVKQIKQILLENELLTGSVECEPLLAHTDVLTNYGCDLKEGDLFPDTYKVARGENRLEVLRLMKRKMDGIKIAWEKAGRHMPIPLKSWNDIITLASIVQKETPKVSEMPIVSSVYLNRLKKKMRLQADPTVVYAVTDGLGDMKGKSLFRSHLKIKSLYNTYENHGLPPAPIANVGREAISAVLKAADTNYLFFVADGHGGHSFSRTYAEHQKKHEAWRKMKAQLNN